MFCLSGRHYVILVLIFIICKIKGWTSVLALFISVGLAPIPPLNQKCDGWMTREYILDSRYIKCPVNIN